MTQEIIKIVGIAVQMPYHDEVYIVGEKPEGHISGNMAKIKKGLI